MSSQSKTKLRFAVTCLLILPAARAQGWATWGGGADRLGWAKTETAISPQTAPKLALKWRLQLDIKPKFEVLSSSTAPVIAENVGTPRGRKDLVFVVAYDDTVYAVAADTGEIVWRRRFENPLKPGTEATYLCPNTQNTTPVVDPRTGTLYVLTSDGRLHSLSTSTGEELAPATDFVPPFARTWSLNLVDGVIYTPVTRGCGGAVLWKASVSGPVNSGPITYRVGDRQFVAIAAGHALFGFALAGTR